MANVYVTISFNNGRPAVNPDPALVNPGDTVVWQLAQGLHWPALPGQAIAYLSGTQLIPSVSFVSGTVQGTVSSTAAPGDEESYNASINANSEYGEVLLSSHQPDDITFDPKIKVKTPTEP
jgi:hypothetical protein